MSCCLWTATEQLSSSSAAVRYGRVPKRSLSGEDQSVSTTQPVEGHPKVEEAVPDGNCQMAIFDVIYSISHSHTAHCSETEDKVLAMAKAPVTLVSSARLLSVQIISQGI